MTELLGWQIVEEEVIPTALVTKQCVQFKKNCRVKGKLEALAVEAMGELTVEGEVIVEGRLTVCGNLHAKNVVRASNLWVSGNIYVEGMDSLLEVESKISAWKRIKASHIKGYKLIGEFIEAKSISVLELYCKKITAESVEVNWHSGYYA
jgi:cytoskeletal protein CcmA (bactofilin family)